MHRTEQTWGHRFVHAVYDREGLSSQALRRRDSPIREMQIEKIGQIIRATRKGFH